MTPEVHICKGHCPIPRLRVPSTESSEGLLPGNEGILGPTSNRSPLYVGFR